MKKIFAFLAALLVASPAWAGPTVGNVGGYSVQLFPPITVQNASYAT